MSNAENIMSINNLNYNYNCISSNLTNYHVNRCKYNVSMFPTNIIIYMLYIYNFDGWYYSFFFW